MKVGEGRRQSTSLRRGGGLKEKVFSQMSLTIYSHAAAKKTDDPGSSASEPVIQAAG